MFKFLIGAILFAAPLRAFADFHVVSDCLLAGDAGPNIALTQNGEELSKGRVLYTAQGVRLEVMSRGVVKLGYKLNVPVKDEGRNEEIMKNEIERVLGSLEKRFGVYFVHYDAGPEYSVEQNFLQYLLGEMSYVAEDLFLVRADVGACQVR